jgi:hypothetical protein
MQVKLGHKNCKQNFRKCDRTEMFRNDSNKSKFDLGGNYETIKFWQCMLTFGAEPFVLSSPTEVRKI